MDIDWQLLRERARAATANSYSPYSSYPVGAAGLTSDGEILTAANVENASYVAGICAETALVGVLIASGRRPGDLVAVSVADPDGHALSPCGRCRQLLHEIGGPDLLVDETPMSRWLPEAFGPGDLS